MVFLKQKTQIMRWYYSDQIEKIYNSLSCILYYPIYMMIKMIMDDEIWHLVGRIPKVYGFLGGKKGEPLPISQQEIDSIQNQMKDGKILKNLSMG